MKLPDECNDYESLLEMHPLPWSIGPYPSIVDNDGRIVFRAVDENYWADVLVKMYLPLVHAYAALRRHCEKMDAANAWQPASTAPKEDENGK